MAEGWICPRCGRALAPWMSECPCYYNKLEVTSNFTVEFPPKPFNDYGPSKSGMALYDIMTGKKLSSTWYDHNE